MIQNLRSFFGARLHLARAQIALRSVIRQHRDFPEVKLDRGNWMQSLEDPSEFYRKCVGFFHCGALPELTEHRAYFAKNDRGFGEDAFHVMWWMLVREFRPASFLEIGVYRGQTLSLISLLHRHFDIAGTVTGISPFLPAGDAVSKYRDDLDYFTDTLSNFDCFKLPRPELLKAFSTDSVAVEKIRSLQWDAIYIDGNHDYVVAREDWNNCAAAVKLGGIVVLDDSGLTTNYKPPAFATGGHPDPSRLATEIDPAQFKEILQVGHNRVFQRMA